MSYFSLPARSASDGFDRPGWHGFTGAAGVAMCSLSRRPFPSTLALLLFLSPVVSAQTPDAQKPKSGPDAATWRQSATKAIQYLRIKGQASDGSYSAQAGPAVTALVVTAELRTGLVSADEPHVARALQYLKGFVRDDGGIYAPESVHRNYETSLGLQAFQAANRDARYRDLVKNAQEYLKKLQWDDDEGHGPASASYGGAGYGRHARPDLSNTQFLLDALKESGIPADDPAMQRALVFVSRCQNLESEHNTLPFAAKVNDGGFYYTPVGEGESQAGKNPDGGLRSYASMTYAGLKSMIYAGVGPDDPRVKAAVAWIRKHYSLQDNPGMGADGLYYFYHTFAKALDAMKLDTISDSTGTPHDWRRELAEELFRRQRPDGSWINEGSKRWYEGDPNLVTAYALLAMGYCKPVR